jgi:hypothetical protein
MVIQFVFCLTCEIQQWVTVMRAASTGPAILLISTCSARCLIMVTCVVIQHFLTDYVSDHARNVMEHMVCDGRKSYECERLV